MSYDTLVLAQHEAVLTITVNRPEVRNAQSRITREEFDDTLAKAGQNGQRLVPGWAGVAETGTIDDTVAGILDSIWTDQVIAFILPVPTFFPKGANHVRTG